MAFQIKQFVSIVAAMVNHMKATQSRITDFNVGSVARTLVEAPAIEIDELYQQMFHGLKEAIPVATFNSFGFERLPAVAASGPLRFTLGSPAGSPVTIPAGTSVRLPSGTRLYTTQAAAIIGAGQTTVDTLAVCQEAGIAGNVAAGALTQLVSSVTGNPAVTNPNAFANGRDVETDGERTARFQAYIATLPRGTVAALEYGAKMARLLNEAGEIVESVVSATVVEPYLSDPYAERGYVLLYIHNGSGGTSADLVEECQRVIDGYTDGSGTPVPGWKAAGVLVEVLAASEIAVPVSAALTVLSGYVQEDAEVAAESAMRDYLQGLPVGAAAVQAELIALAMGVDGVSNIALSAPAVDVAVPAGAKIVAGSFTWA